MTPLTFILVVLVAFIAGVASVVDERQFHRPLVACTLMGLALGDLPTGIMLGGFLELIALGWMNVGAAMAPDSALASTISALVVIQGHQNIDTGIAIAVPLAAAGQVLTIFVRTITVFFQHQADNFAKTANFRGIELMHLSGMALQGLRVAIPTAIVALISSDELTRLLNMIPAEVTTGLRIAGGMITVVGFAMVINMMRSKALMPFFFLGFIAAAAIPATQSIVPLPGGSSKDVLVALSTPAQFNLVAIGLVGACLGLLYTQLNPLFHKSEAPAVAPAAANDLDNELE
ncbi:PTS mannose/fructose/sorbose transporter subunit IIC [Rothia mucilaginosa]|jgi:phosphotransferase system, mannose/fructose/N-acetylgalactosamine-specific component IIC|uniref:PTS mannose/fructose/sorbose transporter subunit IIC n=1 Tax=Rothia mucilaginosa TaxID=43675 RepID=UPI00066C6082|nr:PTS mannose/fructose/sorbose transporter subunit IIC [Rothia mucilaginosa]